MGRQDRTIQASRAETVFASDPREGKDYGTYRVLRSLGIGGMGQVYLALDTRLGRHIALKFIDERLTYDPTMLDRLYQEARTASSLNHPNILTIYEIGEAAGEHFIASEFVEGLTLGDAIDRKLVTPKMSVEIAAQVASALVAAHAAGVIHRDLKATNIMLRPDGIVKVIDFGLAKRTLAVGTAAGEQHRPLSAPGGMVGTVEYMSPEQARGEAVDQRTDLWGLGVVLYEMLAGKFPFDGPSEAGKIVAILNQPFAPIENAASLPRGVTAIIEHALAKDRTLRYQSAGEMLRDLQGLGITKQRISSVKRFAVLAESKQLGRIAMSVAAFAALASAFAIWWFAFNGKEQVLGPDWFEPGPAEQVTFNGKVDAATISPDGHYLAYTSRENGKGILHIRNLATKSEWHLPPYEETTYGLTFEPNSKSLYYVLHDRREWGRLYSVDVRGGLPKMRVDDIDGPVAFSPDGKQFVFLRRAEDQHAATYKIILSDTDDTGNQREIVKKVGTNIDWRFSWSDRQDRIAATIYSEGLHSSLRGGLFFYSPEGKLANPTPISDESLRSISSLAWIPGTNVVASVAQSNWRTNNEAGLYEIAANQRELKEFPSPPFLMNLSFTKDAKLLSAIEQIRTASFWVAEKGSLHSHQIAVPAGTDTGSLERFGWDSEDSLVFPSAQPRSINLFRLTLSGQIQRLTNSKTCSEREPAYVPSKSLIVYVSNCASFGNAHNLWQLNLKTGQSTQMTAGSSRDEEPDVSSNGNWIVYTAWPATITSLWKLPLGGGTPQQLSQIQARHAAISPDGKHVLCQVREGPDGRFRFAVLSLASGNILRELWNIPVLDLPARWEPDGQAIDFIDQRQTQIWRKSLSSDSPAEPLTDKTTEPIIDFSWSPNGNKLAFVTIHTNNDVVFFRRKMAH